MHCQKENKLCSIICGILFSQQRTIKFKTLCSAEDNYTHTKKQPGQHNYPHEY